MKKVLMGEELREKINEGVSMLCNTVKTTLGAMGSNAIIDHSSFSPFITNDGVTIATNIESEDEAVNTILTLAKEASINTDLEVGDGTTTTLVLLQNIYENGVKLIDSGVNPMVIKKELFLSLEKVLNLVRSKAWIPSENDILNIASVSANSEEIGKIVSEAYLKVGNKEAIKITEGNKEIDEVIYKNGYIVDTMLASSYYFKDTNKIDITQPYVLLVNGFIDNIESLASVINQVVKESRTLVIFAEDYSDQFVNQIVSMYLENISNIYLLKTPGYGMEKVSILKDLSMISGGKIVNQDVNFTDIGVVKNISINKEETIISFVSTPQIDEFIKSISVTNEEENIKRVNMLNGIQAEIQVGAITTTQRREKKMRFDDAVCAVGVCKAGVLLGGGVTLYQVSEEMEVNNQVEEIIKNSLKSIFNQIMYNAGVDSSIIEEIRKSDYTKVYNVLNERLEDKSVTSVIDPVVVIQESLKNAVSIASMLLTTTSLVINENINNLGIINEYK